MKEEKVTINILNWLEANDWEVICYDFPQSGTGVMIHPNNSEDNSKNKGGIIPDIIAVKNSTALFFENKNRFYLPDFEKLKEIKDTGNYTNGINSILSKYNIQTIFYGIGIPNNLNDIEKSQKYLFCIDFLLTVDLNENITINYDKHGIFA